MSMQDATAAKARRRSPKIMNANFESQILERIVGGETIRAD
jgi:hypothetical protein